MTRIANFKSLNTGQLRRTHILYKYQLRFVRHYLIKCFNLKRLQILNNGSQPPDSLNKTRNVNVEDTLSGGNALRGCDPCGLSGTHATRHHAERSQGLPVSGNAPACHKKIREIRSNERPVRHIGRLFKFYPHLLRSAACMNVYRMYSPRYTVLVPEPVNILLRGDRVHAEYATGLTDARLRRSGRDIGVPEFREILAQEFRETENVLPQAAFHRCEIAVVSGICCTAGDVYCHAALVEHIVEPRASEIRNVSPGLLEGQKFLPYRTALARTVYPVVVHAFVQEVTLRVHTREDEAER